VSLPCGAGWVGRRGRSGWNDRDDCSGNADSIDPLPW